MHWGSPCQAYCVVFDPSQLRPFIAVETQQVENLFYCWNSNSSLCFQCQATDSGLHVWAGVFPCNAYCTLVDLSQLTFGQWNTSSNSQMTASKPVSFVQELNKGITGTNPFSKLILVYEPVIFFLCFVRLDWGLVVA